MDNKEIYDANESVLGYLNEKANLKDDCYIKILPRNNLLDVETNKNKSARLNLDELFIKNNKKIFNFDFLNLDNDEYLENCYQFKKYIF